MHEWMNSAFPRSRSADVVFTDGRGYPVGSSFRRRHLGTPGGQGRWLNEPASSSRFARRVRRPHRDPQGQCYIRQRPSEANGVGQTDDDTRSPPSEVECAGRRYQGHRIDMPASHPRARY
jgi:hypothetical protein